MTAVRLGRPPRIETEIASEQLFIRVTPGERRAIGHAADELRITITELIRQAVNEFVGDFSERKPFSSDGTQRSSVS